ncbi:SMC-Scp complex subunit ScpB [Luteimonas soli]
MDPILIKRIVEAALLAANQPLTAVQLHALFPLDEPAPEGSIAQALESLQADCAERGVELVELASGWRYQVKADVHAWVARLWTERQTKYTRATLETLALVAYRQPITRGEIEQVRGVAVNSNIIKALEEREWIRVVGHRDVPGRPELLGTTKGFLDYFGLKRLDELPPLSELKDFGELDPQLQFDGKADGETMPVGDISAEGAGIAQDDGEDASPVAADDDTDTRDIPDPADDAGLGTANPETTAADDDADQSPTDPSQDDTNTDALAAEGDSTRSMQ